MVSGELTEEQKMIWETFDREVTALMEGGGTQQAIDRLSAGISSMESDPAMEPVRARALSRRAELRLDLEDGDGALADAKRAISMGYVGADALSAAGWAAYYLDKAEVSREYFDQSLSVEEGQVSTLHGRALALVELEEWELARADLVRALSLEEEDTGLLALMGEVLLRTGDLEGAQGYLGQALGQEPDPDVALNLARVMYVRGDIAGALSYVDAVDDDAEEMYLEALLFRSFLRAQHGMVSEARSDAIRASNLYPDEAFAFVQLAQVEMVAERSNMMKRAADRAVLLDPSLSDAYMVRGAAYQMMGMEEEASEDFERAQKAPLELPIFLLGPAYGVMNQQSPFGKELFDLFGREDLFGKAAAGGGFDPANFASAFEKLGGLGGFGGFGGGQSDEEGVGSEKRSGRSGKGPMPGMDPMSMLGQLFDESGNMKGPLKPLVTMAIKNAPKIMKNMPPGLLAGVDPEELERLQKGEVSSEEIEERMREFYQMMQSGKKPDEEE